MDEVTLGALLLVVLAAIAPRGEPATFVEPVALAFDAAGNLYVSDRGDQTIRRIEPDGRITTFAGVSGEYGFVDGRGSDARLWSPGGITFDRDGNLLVADVGNHAVRRITPDGTVKTIVASTMRDDDTIVVPLSYAESIAVLRDGTLFIAETTPPHIWRIDPNRNVSEIALPKVERVGRIAADRDGSLLLVDPYGTFWRYRNAKWTRLAGFVRPPEGPAIPLAQPNDIAVDARGTIYLATSGYTTSTPADDTGGYGVSDDFMHALSASGVWRRIPGRPAQAIAVDGNGRIAIVGAATKRIVSIRGEEIKEISSKRAAAKQSFDLRSISVGKRFLWSAAAPAAALPSTSEGVGSRRSNPNNIAFARIPSTSHATLTIDANAVSFTPDVAGTFDISSDARRVRVIAAEPPALASLADELLARPVIPQFDPKPPSAPSMRTFELAKETDAAVIDRFDKAKDETLATGYVQLSRIAWNAVAPTLLRWSSAEQSPRHRAIALQLRYRHALAANDSARDTIRGQLQRIVESRTAPPSAREIALEALMLRVDGSHYVPEPLGWRGRDDWFLALFRDETLFDTREENIVGSTLAPIAAVDSARWAPLVIPLLRDSASRANAMVTLIRVIKMSFEPQCEICAWPQPSPAIAPLAARALLPWISDPKWTRESRYGHERNELISGVARLKVDEARPLLRKALDAEPSSTPILTSLVLLGDAGVAQRLRAHSLTLDENNRRWTHDTLLKSNAISLDERAAAVESYVRFALDPQNEMTLQRVWVEKLPFDVSLGRYIAMNSAELATVIPRLIERFPQLRDDDPAVAARLLSMLARNDDPHAAPFLLGEIAANRADANTIANVLARRAKYAAAAAQLRSSSPIVAVIAGETPTISRLVLAVARLANIELPLHDVLAFHDDLAVDRYLAAIDTPSSRAALYDRHPREIVFSGAPLAPRSGSEPADAAFIVPCCCTETFAQREAELRREVMEGKAEEIVAVLRSSGDLCSMTRGFTAIRNITPALRAALDRWDAAPSSAAFDDRYTESHTEVVHVTKRGARRAIVSGESDLVRAIGR